MMKLFITATFIFRLYSVHSMIFVSDLRTPSFLIDLDVLRKTSGLDHAALYCSKYDVTLIPVLIDQSVQETFCGHIYDLSRLDSHDRHSAQSSLGYWHSSLVNNREFFETIDSSVLSEIDLSPSLCVAPNEEYSLQQNGATLVLGINNHHVGSYYWARSVGMGASMEAPGITFNYLKRGDNRGVLRWEKEGGPTECNSNDGKRSEWVSFLKLGDQVQLVPKCIQDSIMSCIRDPTDDNSYVYGFTSKGRPLGSEPVVICKYVAK